MAHPISCNLLALTGFGNEALRSLLQNSRCRILGLYTRAEKGPFPYYAEENLAGLARTKNIPVYIVPASGAWNIRDSADLNLAATFHRLLKETHLSRARRSVNLHPSLLPSYKGPTPTNWMIANREKLCGLSAHIMTTGVDSGPLIYQKEYPLAAATDADLRKFLAGKVGDAVEFILDRFPEYREISSPYPESSYPSFHAAAPRPPDGGAES